MAKVKAKKAMKKPKPKKAAAKAKPKAAPAKVQAIPKGFHTVTPQLVIDDCAAAMEFYKKALGAAELMRMPGPDGRIMHAEMKIGDSIVFMSDFMGEMMKGWGTARTLGAVTCGFYLYVKDVDALHRQAVGAGATETMAPTDMFWGDRTSGFKDPFGNLWNLATHIKDMTPQEALKANPMKQAGGS